MKRFAWIWVFKLLCAALGIAAMMVMTQHVLRLERESRDARHQAEHAEKVRLALWRMESEANALLLLENTRATTDFLDTSVPAADYVLTYFEFSSSAEVQSTMGGATQQRLQSLLAGPAPAGIGIVSNCQMATTVASQWSYNSVNAWGEGVNQQVLDVEQIQQNEKTQRQAAVNRSYSNMKSANIAQKGSPPEQGGGMLIAGNYRPLWLDGELFLVRQVLGSAGQRTQGVWLRRDVIKKRLLDLTRDLFADADLLEVKTPVIRELKPPLAVPDSSSDALALVSLPWSLAVTEVPDLSPIGPSPAMTALRFAWVGLSVAFVAGSLLVMGLVRLSERRAAFVSSVTHELRTPLTTFQLYTDLLANGMVRDETKRQGYFETLRREADRLGHLVENVLAFAQVERGSARGGIRELRLNDVLPAIVERMETRLQQVGWQVDFVITATMQERIVRTDPVALEHILLNLTDNAAKYAQPSSEPKVELRCDGQKGRWEISLRDFGPGIEVREQRHIFRAFHKSAQAAAHSKPGVGLGLALSRRLAKSIGAKLEYRTMSDGGACFVLLVKG